MPRPHEIDEETGLPIPHSDFDHYGRLMHLVPDAQCTTRAGKIIEWKDERPQPTYDEIDAVSDADAELALLPSTEDLVGQLPEFLIEFINQFPAQKNTAITDLKLRRGK